MRKKKLITSDDYEIGSMLWKYARMIEERRGHNYQHLNDKISNIIESKGYKFYIFKNNTDVTMSEFEAIEVVESFRKSNHFARVVTGKETNVQRIRMYSVIYKQKVKI